MAAKSNTKERGGDREQSALFVRVNHYHLIVPSIYEKFMKDLLFFFFSFLNHITLEELEKNRKEKERKKSIPFEITRISLRGENARCIT